MRLAPTALVVAAGLPVTLYPGIAVYDMTRTENGQPRSYEVRFDLDVDGVWRAGSF